jgi:CubicO group peptidase (beta-lactamase class C family)
VTINGAFKLGLTRDSWKLPASADGVVRTVKPTDAASVQRMVVIAPVASARSPLLDSSPLRHRVRIVLIATRVASAPQSRQGFCSGSKPGSRAEHDRYPVLLSRYLSYSDVRGKEAGAVMSRYRCFWLAIGILALAMPAAAKSAGIANLIANKPEVENWLAFGKGETHWRQRNAAIQGGVALHVEIEGKQANAWDAQTQAKTDRDIKKDDKLLFAFWARGTSDKPIPATVQGLDAPYPVMGSAKLAIAPDWQLYCVAGTATSDFKPEKFGGVLQTGTARQTIDLGPAFLLAARTPAERKLIQGGCASVRSAISAYTIAPPSIAELQKKLEKILADTKTPGLSIAIVRQNGPEWIAGLGKANVAQNVPARADTLFRIGSISKTFAALSILKLTQEGTLSLDAPLHKIAPEIWFKNEWEASDPVRVVDLLTHTTGWNDLPLSHYTERFGGYTDLGKQLDLLRSSRVSRWRPGTRMSYCNMGPVVAAYLVEKITHQRFEDYVAENFFKPIGMSTATYFPPDAKHAVTLYHGDGKTPFPYWHISGRPAGSINASANDMASLVAFFLHRGMVDGRQVVPASVIAEMETPRRSWASDAGLKTGYGLANYTSVQDGLVWRGHDGGVAGGLSNMEYLPQAGIGYFISINSGSGPALYQIAKTVRNYLTLDIRPEQAPKAAALPKDAEAYAGWYEPASVRNAFMEGIQRLLGVSLVRIRDGAVVVSALGDFKQTYLPVTGALLRRDNMPVATVALLSEPEGRFIQLGMGNTMKQIPAWLVWLQFFLMAWFALALVSIVVYLPCWLIRGIWKKHRKPQERWLRLWPLIALVAFAAGAGTSALAGEDVIDRLGNLTVWSAGIWLATVVFAVACMASLVSVLRARGARRIAYGYALAVSLALVIAAAYLTWWGLIGVPLWM